MLSIRNFTAPIFKAVSRRHVSDTLSNSRSFASSHILGAPALTEAITGDHKKILEYYNEVVSSKDVEHQERYGNQFIWELARHSVAEELIIYPAMEKYMPKGAGKDHAEKDRKQHHIVSSRDRTSVDQRYADFS